MLVFLYIYWPLCDWEIEGKFQSQVLFNSKERSLKIVLRTLHVLILCKFLFNLCNNSKDKYYYDHHYHTGNWGVENASNLSRVT